MMDEKKYRYFKFDAVFCHQRGQRLTSQDQTPGDIAYISSTSANNGLDNYITPPNNMPIYKNKLTLSNSGSVGYLFYHDYDFVASDHVMVIWPQAKELNRYIALFLKPIFETIRYRYNFGREITDTRLPKEQLYLPVDQRGQPDWQYMEDCIKSLEQKVKFKPIKSRVQDRHSSVDTTNWKEFRFIDKQIWESIVHGKRLIKEHRVAGNMPYYSASEYDNGVTDAIDNPLFTVSDSIIYSTFGTAFWVEGNFTASDEIYSFYNHSLNKYTALFIATIMKQNQYKFKFGRKAFYNKFENEILKLPADEQGQPDWQYMESYIKSLPYAEYL